MPGLSVVVPATDAPETLGRCLAAIRAAAEPPDQVIIVDRPENANPAWARNVGTDRATKEIIVYIDADVEVAPDAFQRIRRAFDADKDLVALFGSYDDDPERNGLVSDFRNLLHHHVHQSAPGFASTFWSGLGAIRRDAFLTVGGFDESRFPEPSIEDIELGMRLVANGRRVVLDPAIQGKHLKRWTVVSMMRTDLLRRGAPWVQLLLETKSSSTALNLGWRHRASVVSSLLLLAAVGGRQPRLAAGSLAAIVLLNRSFYLLLLQRRGWRLVAAGVPLHVFHHILSAAAVPLGMAAYVRGRVIRARRSSS